MLSDSVFAYFPSVEYGKTVLQKMFDKANKVVGILEVFDSQMEQECNQHRRAMIEDYDKKYSGLDKTFYPREMFIEFARKNNCRIEFTKVDNKYYWNSQYLYNVFLFKG